MHDGWIVGIKFLQEISQERAQSATALHKKNINVLHVELGYFFKAITHATAKALGIQLTSAFKPSEDCALRKPKRGSLKNFGRKVFPLHKLSLNSYLCR